MPKREHTTRIPSDFIPTYRSLTTCGTLTPTPSSLLIALSLLTGATLGPSPQTPQPLPVHEKAGARGNFRFAHRRLAEGGSFAQNNTGREASGRHGHGLCAGGRHWGRHTTARQVRGDMVIHRVPEKPPSHPGSTPITSRGQGHRPTRQLLQISQINSTGCEIADGFSRQTPGLPESFQMS